MVLLERHLKTHPHVLLLKNPHEKTSSKWLRISTLDQFPTWTLNSCYKAQETKVIPFSKSTRPGKQTRSRRDSMEAKKADLICTRKPMLTVGLSYAVWVVGSRTRRPILARISGCRQYPENFRKEERDPGVFRMVNTSPRCRCSVF